MSGYWPYRIKAASFLIHMKVCAGGGYTDNPKVIATCERRKKLALITELFWTYMESLFYVSRGKTGWRGTGKRDYRHRSRIGCV